ncbi:MAG: hypothetical protein WBB97_06700 [Dehalococcoidales bacterium]
MKKLTKFWGIFIAIVLASTLILSAAPVSAGTLSWGSEDLPDQLADLDGDDIVDMAVSGDGSVIYVTSNNSQEIKRSTNGGQSWSTIAFADTTFNCQNIAVAPDDPNYIACASANSTVYISDDAGANWDTLGMANDDVNFTVRDIDVSVMKGSNHYVALAGIDEGDTAAEIHSYKIGAIGADWDEISTDDGFSAADQVAGAVAFSPNFYSDQVLAAVTADTTNHEVNLQVYSYNQGNWNSGAFSDFPEDMQQDTPTNVASMEAASIAMAPDYLGSDDSMRTVFVGLTINDGDDESSGIFRVDNVDTTALKDEKQIYSVAFDGSLLVAGRYDAIDIYRSTDALDDSPSVSGSTGTKEPGGADKVLVGIAGSEVVAGTSGDDSAFAYSEDNGKTFNDLSLIDTFLSTLCDVAVTPDGSNVYLVTADNDTTKDLSLWALGSRWERIYSKLDVDETDYIVRLAPDDSDVIYLADGSGTNMYYSSDAGMDKWHTRVYKESTGIVDMAVEGDGDTVYVLTTVGNVSKSTNRGFTWDSKKASKLSNSGTIASLGEDLVIAGSTDGRVAYSTDGNSSWTKLDNDSWAGGTANTVHATATGLSDGDFVIAACGAGVNAWELGSDDEWDDISPDAISGNVTNGIGIFDGVLYVIADDGTDSVLARTLTPTADSPGWSSVEYDAATLEVAPTALRISAGTGLTKLWAIDDDTAGEALVSYKDTLATAVTNLSLPADDSSIPFNPVSGASSQIIFTWVSPSDKVDDFDFTIATDSGFDEVVLDQSVAKSSGTWDSGNVISKIVGPGAAENFAISFMPDTTYYWKVRVDLAGPVRSNWSEVRSFTTGSLPEAQAPVIIQQPPAPVIEVPSAPEIILQPPDIILPAPTPAPEIVIPAAPAPAPAVPSWAIYAIIIIGAVLVIALIVLIMRTRRPV